MTTRANITRTMSPATLDKIEATILACAQTTMGELAAETGLTIGIIRRYARELIDQNKAHKVRRPGAGDGVGAILAAGPALLDADGEAVDPVMEPVRMTTRHWAGSVRRPAMDAFLFGAATGAREVRA